MTDNYEAVRQTWRQKFLQMDCKLLAKKFGLKLDGDFLYMTYFTHPYAIDRKTAKIIRLDKPDAPIGFNLEMNFFNRFHYAVEHPVPSRNLVPFRNVKRVYPFEKAYIKTIIRPFEAMFAGHVPELQRALQALNARPLPQGDAGGAIEVFPGLEIAVLFWDADDEFAAQANMLFDSNITDFMHEENVVCVASDAVHFLAEASDLGDPDALIGSEY